MGNRRVIQNVAIIVLGIAIIVMSVGYAAYSSTLEINGDVTVKAAKWDVHFENLGEGTVPAGTHNAAISTTNNKLVEFDVELQPGEKYDFTVDVVNAGTFDAKLISTAGTGSTVKAASAASATSIVPQMTDDGRTYSDNVIDYKVTYSDGTALVPGTDVLTKKGGSLDKKTVKVAVEYKTDENHPEYLPSEDTVYHFVLLLNYEQAA